MPEPPRAAVTDRFPPAPAPGPLGQLSRYFHTLAPLRPIQWWSRARYRLTRPRADLRPAPALTPMPGRPYWIGPTWRRPMLQADGPPGQLRGLAAGECHRVTIGQGPWQAPDASALWSYHLHYRDDLHADCPQTRAAAWGWLSQWCDDHPPGSYPAWDPYPISLRLTNVFKAILGGRTADSSLLQSLAVQTRWLCQRLETHLLGNHLWANARALLVSGACFSGPEADGWLQLGGRLLEEQLAEQVLADAGHVERSPMYHALIVEDVLDLLTLDRCLPDRLPSALVRQLQDRLPAMLTWLCEFSRPDGGPSHFNDSVAGVAAPLPVLLDYAARLSLAPAALPAAPIRHYPASGFVRADLGPASLQADVGAIAPAWQPGHAHAETLSFELSLDGRPVVVNTGIDRYGRSAERLWQRGTAAHSTVVVEGRNSSDVWSGFRVGRRARVTPARIGQQQLDTGQPVLCLVGEHDGYRQWQRPLRHQRTWRLMADRLIVLDRLIGASRPACALFHFHPSWTLQACSDRTLEAVCPSSGSDTRVLRIRVNRGFTILSSTHYSGFGCADDGVCLAVDFLQDVQSEFHWAGS